MNILQEHEERSVKVSPQRLIQVGYWFGVVMIAVAVLWVEGFQGRNALDRLVWWCNMDQCCSRYFYRFNNRDAIFNYCLVAWTSFSDFSDDTLAY